MSRLNVVLVLLCFVAATLAPPASARAAAGRGAARLSQAAGAAASRGKAPRKPVGKGKAKGKGKGKPAKPGGPDGEAAATAPALPEPRPLPTAYAAVALMPLAGIDVDLDLLHELEIALLNEIDETRGLRSISPGDVRGDLERFDIDLAACEGAAACIGQAARYAGAHQALDVKVAALGGTLSVSMRLIDSQSGLELSRVAEPVSENPSERATELHRLAVQTLKPELYVGTLKIDCSEEGADVYLDDKLIGRTPLAHPLKNLRAGVHILRLAKAGYADLNQFVDVVYNRSSTIQVDLSTTMIAGVMVEAESQSGHGALYVLTDDPGIELRIDGEPAGVTVLDQPITGIPAGTRRLSCRQEGQEPAVLGVDLKAGERTDIVVERTDSGFNVRVLQTVPTTDPLPTLEDLKPKALVIAMPVQDEKPAVPLTPTSLPPPAPEATWKLYAGLSAAGAGVVALGLTSFFAARVGALQKDASDQVVGLTKDGDVYTCTNVTFAGCQQRLSELDSISANAHSAQQWQWITLGSGAALLVVGGAFLGWEHLDVGLPYLRSDPEPATTTPSTAPAPAESGAASPGVSISAMPLPGGGAIGIGGSF